ncbi:MAG: HAMP domain-containing sensor histidine kinase [Tissierellia bacterium]|nr:HAMP domain-containing sensor histidine kinase [Tissierellia bacterium]
MGIAKEIKISSSFIKFIISIGFAIVILMALNIIIFGYNTFIVYPANYSERLIDENFDRLKNDEIVDENLLSPMSKFGVFGKEGNYLYGNINSFESRELWDTYKSGKLTRSYKKYITTIDRADEILLIEYPLKLEYRSEYMRNNFPNAELSIVIFSILEIILIIIIAANIYSKKMKKELDRLIFTTEKIAMNDLDFDLNKGNIYEINQVLNSMDQMRKALKDSLEKQWEIEYQKREQISSLAHDLKTPLTVVKGNAELLNETDLDGEQKSFCNDIMKGSLQIERYIHSLLEIARDENIKKSIVRPVNLQSILENIESESKLICNTKNIELIWKNNIDKDLKIMVDESDILRIVLNIVSNSVDFSPKNSKLTIINNLEDNQLKIEIIDEGIGFTDYILSKGKEQFVMDDSSRTSKNHYGMGLYIANKLAEKYNGELKLENLKPKGAKVSIRLLI